ncbi:MAG: hypothetical protein OQL19_00970, partial [Gammaproteobacteria bacterium]|nr:hypothetical protein [Gammaproteobacteria bacterium]
NREEMYSSMEKVYNAYSVLWNIEDTSNPFVFQNESYLNVLNTQTKSGINCLSNAHRYDYLVDDLTSFCNNLVLSNTKVS